MSKQQREVDLTGLLVGGRELRADLTQVITEVSLDLQEGEVNEISFTAQDPDRRLAKSGLIVPGTPVRWRDRQYVIAGRGYRRGQDNTRGYVFRCRSPLARAMRAEYKVSVEQKVGADEWLTDRAQTHGGQAVCQPTAKQSAIAQAGGKDRQNELDVLASLASDLDRSWIERDTAGGVIWFGERHWAWEGGLPGQKDWPVTWLADEGSDALESDIEWDEDDIEGYANGTVTVPYELGNNIKLWDRLDLGRGFDDDKGLFLVTGSTITADKAAGIPLTVTLPKPPSAKAGSAE